jgi:hypothetical protein
VKGINLIKISLALVCQNWQEMAWLVFQEIDLCSRPSKIFTGPTMHDRTPRLLDLTRFKRLKSLKLTTTHINDTAPIFQLTTLQELIIEQKQSEDLSIWNLSKIFEKLTNLTSIHLSGFNNEDRKLIDLIGNLTRLRSLALTKSPYFELSDLVKLTKLRTLNIEQYGHFTGSRRDYATYKGDYPLALISNFYSLAKIHLYFVYWNNKLQEILQKLPNLVTIYIDRCMNERDLYNSIVKMSKVSYLIFHDFNTIEVDQLEAILTMPSLKSLTISSMKEKNISNLATHPRMAGLTHKLIFTYDPNKKIL